MLGNYLHFLEQTDSVFSSLHVAVFIKQLNFIDDLRFPE
jgi:hypothetical protein